MPLNYNNSVPLHIQLKNDIEDKILKGIYKGKIPSERDIMEDYYVSRNTVREAINQLVREGMLEKRHGRGTFVFTKPINDWLGTLSSTTETIKRMGMQPGAKLIECRKIILPENIQNLSGIKEAYHIKRLRFADEIAIGIENNYYPIEIGEKIIKYDLNKVTLYDVLERELSIRIHEADQLIKSGQLSKVDADYLGIPKHLSVIIAERNIKDVEGNFVEYEHASYRADMYSFKITLSRKQL